MQRLRSHSEAEQVAAAAELGQLALSTPENQAAVLAAGSVPALVQLLRSHKKLVQGAVCWALSSLATQCNLDGRAANAAAGGISQMARLLHASSNDRVLVSASLALRGLMLYGDSYVAAVAETSCVPRLLQLLRDSSSEVVQQQMANLLASLAHEGEGCAEEAVARGGVPLLLQRLQSSEQSSEHSSEQLQLGSREQLQLGCVRALANMVGSAGPAAAIVAAGAAPALSRLLQNSGNQNVFVTAAFALSSLKRHGASSTAAEATASCIPCLVQLLRTGSKACVRVAAADAPGMIGGSPATAAAAAMQRCCSKPAAATGSCRSRRPARAACLPSSGPGSPVPATCPSRLRRRRLHCHQRPAPLRRLRARALLQR